VKIKSRQFHLAQLNIGRLRFSRGAPELSDYDAALAAIMPIARLWPGFLWIHDDSIIELSERAFGPRMAANLSLWADIESLETFMTCGAHAAVMERRNEWFDQTQDATFVLWWVPEDHRPEFKEACDRLALLRRQGPSPRAFDLKSRFPESD
jgi:hypothetical protein